MTEPPLQPPGSSPVPDPPPSVLPRGDSDLPPSAGLAPRRPRLGWYWLLPALTLLIVAVVLALAWSRSGVPITLRFVEGYGLKPGDAVRCRGIIIGEVRSVQLAPTTGGVLVQAELRPDAREAAQAGSRFWIARPLADLATGVRGLDTVVGAKYIMVLPGGGEPQTDFEGLEAPPIPETIDPSGLELELHAGRLGGLSPGAPVTFRQVRVGSVLRVGLASDASEVRVHVYIRPTFARLVRDRSEFWNTSGVRGSLHPLRGLQFAVESPQALLMGGVALATPPGASKQAASGARFLLAEQAPEKWEEWRPALTVTDARLPVEAILPRPVLATLDYQTPAFLRGTRSYTRRGWVVPIGRDLLGPSDLLRVPAKSKGKLSLAAQPPTSLTVAPGEPEPARPTLTPCWMRSALEKAAPSKPVLRIPTEPEEFLLFGNPEQEPLRVYVGRLKQLDDRWEVDAQVFSDPGPQAWHGAAVVAVKDGMLIGLLMAPDRRQKPYVAPLDKTTVLPPKS